MSPIDLSATLPPYLTRFYDVELSPPASLSGGAYGLTAGGLFDVNAVEQTASSMVPTPAPSSRAPGPVGCWAIYQLDGSPPFVITVDPADGPRFTRPAAWADFNWNTDDLQGGAYRLVYLELDLPAPGQDQVVVSRSFLRTLAAITREARTAAAALPAGAPSGAAGATPQEDLNDLADALEELRGSLRSLTAAARASEPSPATARDEGAAAVVQLYQLAGSPAVLQFFRTRTGSPLSQLIVAGDAPVNVTAGPSTQPQPQPVSLTRSAIAPTDDIVLWTVIRNRTEAISNRPYTEFIESVLCGDGGTRQLDRRRRQVVRERGDLYRGGEAYDIVRAATELFLLHETGVLDPDKALEALDRENVTGNGELAASSAYSIIRPSLRVSRSQLERMRLDYYLQLGQFSGAVLPYFEHILDRLADIPLKNDIEVNGNCYGILKSHLTGPLAMELWWAYWHEEAGIVQAMNTILARFQNRKLRPGLDPLARFELDPLRPLNNLLWGWVQDEINRLTLRRRSLEYEHEYGVRLIGRAVPGDAPVDRRSKFLEAFHNLIYLTHIFYRQDDDTTVVADAFPLLNALRETHLLLAEGAHNQFGDMPWLARAEILVMEWLLARPEMRDFLGGRYMVPYEEPWMDRVDTMRTIQGWGDTNVTHFRDLGKFGEQLLLSIRYGAWNSILNPDFAGNWARFWRSEIQRYAHAYRAATGVDLTEQPDATLPALLLQRRTGRPQVPGRRQVPAAGAGAPAIGGRAGTPSLTPIDGQRQAPAPAQQHQT